MAAHDKEEPGPPSYFASARCPVRRRQCSWQGHGKPPVECHHRWVRTSRSQRQAKDLHLSSSDTALSPDAQALGERPEKTMRDECNQEPVQTAGALIPSL